MVSPDKFDGINGARHKKVRHGTNILFVSRAMQWLNVSYSAWFNRRRQEVGHVFQALPACQRHPGNGITPT
ncbi:MAG: hypothetical protein WCI20_04050 [bacterium]